MGPFREENSNILLEYSGYIQATLLLLHSWKWLHILYTQAAGESINHIYTFFKHTLSFPRTSVYVVSLTFLLSPYLPLLDTAERGCVGCKLAEA